MFVCVIMCEGMCICLYMDGCVCVYSVDVYGNVDVSEFICTGVNMCMYV